MNNKRFAPVILALATVGFMCGAAAAPGRPSPVAACARESDCGELAGSKTARDGAKLTLRAANGVEVNLHDDPADCQPIEHEQTCHHYKLAGKLIPQKAWVVCDSQEAGSTACAETRFVSALNGENFLTTSAEPIYSPDKKWLVALQSESELALYTLRIFSLTRDALAQSFIYSSDDAEPRETRGEFAGWKSGNNFALRVTVNEGSEQIRENIVSFEKGAWSIKRPWSKKP